MISKFGPILDHTQVGGGRRRCVMASCVGY